MKPILKVITTTAVKLTQKQAELIIKTVEKKWNKNTIKLEQIIDKSVIAGIKITIGTEEIDSTVYAKLEKLHTKLRRNI